GIAELREQLKIAFLASEDISGINARDIGIEIFRDIGKNIFVPFRPEVDNFGMPAGSTDGFDNRHGVFAVTVEILIRAAFDFKDNNCLVHGRSLPGLVETFVMISGHCQGSSHSAAPSTLKIAYRCPLCALEKAVKLMGVTTVFRAIGIETSKVSGTSFQP